MKEYSYKKIRQVTESGIVFADGFELQFDECKRIWSTEKGIKNAESNCVAERDVESKEPYFLFYSEERVKLVFDNKGIFSKKRNIDQFHKLQMALNRFGIASFDKT